MSSPSNRLAPVVILILAALYMLATIMDQIVLTIVHIDGGLFLKVFIIIVIVALVSYLGNNISKVASSRETCYKVFTARYAPRTMILNDTSKFARILESLSKRKDLVSLRYSIRGRDATLCIKHRGLQPVELLASLVSTYTRTINIVPEKTKCVFQEFSDSTDLVAKLNNIISKLNNTIIVNLSIFTIPTNNTDIDKFIHIDLGNEPLYSRKMEKLIKAINKLDKSEYNIVIVGVDRQIAELFAEILLERIRVNTCYILYS